MKSIKIFGVRVDKMTEKEATKLVELFLLEDDLKTIYTPNTEIVMEARDDDNLKNILNSGDLVVADGIGLVYASKIKKKPLPERVTGFDLSINMIKLANEKGLSLYLLGGRPGVARKAAENIAKKYPNLKIAGYHHGYFDKNCEGKVLNRISTAKPDILFVGLGFPKQEIWIDKNKDKLKSKLAIGNGGTIDILAGEVKRAPKIFQNMGLEWLYRLMTEPSRIKRQIAIPKFILSVLFSKNVVE